MSELSVFTDENFDDEVIKSDNPVVVFVTARWCRPGRELAPLIDQAAQETHGKVKLGNLDADLERKVVRENRVRSLPTVLLLKSGKLRDRITGRFTKLHLMERMSSVLADDARG